MIKHTLISLIAAILAISALAGCTKDGKNSNDPATTTAATESKAPSSEGNDTAEKKEAEIKEKYTLPADKADELKNEATKKPIVYGGFSYRYYHTPAVASGRPLVSVTPIYSLDGLKKYVQENSHLYELDHSHGSETFAAAVNKYSEEFFLENAVLVVSFRDDEGGGGYQLTGAWEEELHIEDLVMDQLSLALKKSDGEGTCGHLIIEMNSDFASMWDSITMEIYK